MAGAERRWRICDELGLDSSAAPIDLFSPAGHLAWRWTLFSFLSSSEDVRLLNAISSHLRWLRTRVLV